MAVTRPLVEADSIPHDSERIVYVALRDQLSQDFVVLHSYPWLRPDRDGELREGETDFVVLHPEKGVLAIEVKGGELDYRDACWLRKKSRGWEAITDPFVQVRKNMHALLNDIETRSAGDVTRRDITYGYAVIFPHHDYRGQLPPGTDESIVIRQPDIDSLSHSIEQAFASWPSRDCNLDNRRWNKLLNSVLPSFRLYRPLAGENRDVLRSLHELTDEQTQTFQGLYDDNSRVFVRGVAGSGKTWLALDRAVKFAEAGHQTLLVCFNRHLAESLSERVAQSDVYADCLHQLTIRHFHALARELISKAQLQFDVPPETDAARQFWEADVPDLMEQAVMVLMDDDDPQFEAIVVDEGQDFHRRWWECLQFSLLTDSEHGPIYAFSDPDQSLWEWSMDEPPISFGASFRLSRNCRNTQLIARSSAAVAGVETRVFDRSPRGRHISIVEPESTESAKGILLAELRKLLRDEHVSPSELVLIGPFGWKKGSLCSVTEVDDIPLTDSATVWRNGNAILVTTSRSFKGLEAPVVLIYDVEGFSSTFSRTDLYVALTRAQSHCIVITCESELAGEIRTAAMNASKECNT